MSHEPPDQFDWREEMATRVKTQQQVFNSPAVPSVRVRYDPKTGHTTPIVLGSNTLNGESITSPGKPVPGSTMLTFTTGATRSSDEGKPDYEGFLSPLVVKEFGAYMNRHRQQVDGRLRDSDNWQKGMPKDKYIKSLWRHFHDLWMLHRGYKVVDATDGHLVEPLEACCAILFNVMGYMQQLLAPSV